MSRMRMPLREEVEQTTDSTVNGISEKEEQKRLRDEAKREVLASSSSEEDELEEEEEPAPSESTRKSAVAKGKSVEEQDEEDLTEEETAKDEEAGEEDDPDHLGLGQDSGEASGGEPASEDEDFVVKTKATKPSLTTEERLQRRYQTLINRVNVKTDAKILGKPTVELSKLATSVEAALASGDSILLEDHPSLGKLCQETKKIKKVNEDVEIERLCNIQALEAKKRKSKRSDANGKSGLKPRRGKLLGPKSKRKGLDSISSDDEEANGDVSDDEIAVKV
jgi:hypothetical protein